MATEASSLISSEIQHPEYDKICRICHDEVRDPDTKYCNCSGNIKYLHLGCVDEQIQILKNDTCEFCGAKFHVKYKYKIGQPPDSILLWDRFIRFIITWSWLLLIIYIISISLTVSHMVCLDINQPITFDKKSDIIFYISISIMFLIAMPSSYLLDYKWDECQKLFHLEKICFLDKSL